jgi:hypothetical protein
MVHTSTKDGLETELEVANRINGADKPNIWSQAWFRLGRFVVDIRHATASKSSVVTSKGNPIIKERIANEQWFLNGAAQPLADIYLRGHLHCKFTAGAPGTWQGWNLPALQSPKTKYGRQLSNVVHVGISTIEINGDYDWPIYQIYEAPICQEKVLNW